MAAKAVASMRDANGKALSSRDLEIWGELTSLQTQIKYGEKIAEERDRRYTEKAESDERARTAALAAVKEQTAAAFAASKEAIVKAETNQTSYNATHNDLARKNELMLPRTEAAQQFKALEDKIADYRNARDASGKWLLSTLVPAIFSFTATIIALYAVLKK